jgi:hypothetical protein
MAVISKDQIQNLLATNSKAVARALVVLMENQTADEQASDNTRYLNGKGFRPCHAYMGTRMAKFYLARGFLTEKQIAYWRKPMKGGQTRIAIYWAQLQDAAERKAATA